MVASRSPLPISPARMVGGLLLLLALLLTGCAAKRIGTASLMEGHAVAGDGNHVESTVGLVNELKADVSAIKQIQADKADIAGVKAEVEAKAEANAVKIEEVNARLADIEAQTVNIENKADPLTMVLVFAAAALLGGTFLVATLFGVWKLVQYLLTKSECKAKECTYRPPLSRPPMSESTEGDK